MPVDPGGAKAADRLKKTSVFQAIGLIDRKKVYTKQHDYPGRILRIGV